MKIQTLILLVAAVSFTACTDKKEKLREQISELQMTENQTGETKAQLAEVQEEFINQYPDDSMAKTYLENIAIFNQLTGNSAKAIDLSNQYFVRFNSADNSELGTMYLNAARAYSDENQTDSAIHYTEKAMKETSVSLADLRFLGEQFAKLIADTTTQHRDRYMMKYAGIVEQTRGLGEAGLEYQRVYLEYPSSEYAPYCMTKHASIYEANGELDKAREIYEKLIEEYPESNFASNAKSMIDNDLLGKSAAEQLKILRAKKGES